VEEERWRKGRRKQGHRDLCVGIRDGCQNGVLLSGSIEINLFVASTAISVFDQQPRAQGRPVRVRYLSSTYHMQHPLPTPDVDAPPARVPLFETSSQFRNWRFSPERLAATRTSMNNVAVAAIRATFEADEVRPPSAYPPLFSP
jgi:hypothetical protein